MLFRSVEGKPAAAGQNCKITTPGQVIEQALTFQLSTGPQSLVQADEINEIIGALINQLTLQAMQGLTGLLGLGGNSNYTDYGNYGTGTSTSYIDAANDQTSTVNLALIRTQMVKSLQIETEFHNLASNTTKTKAYQDLALVTTGLNAIDSLLANANATYLGIVSNSTYNNAVAKVNYASTNGTLTPTEIAELEALLSSVDEALVPMTNSNSNAANTTFTSLKNQAIGIQTDLQKVVGEADVIIAQTNSNIAILNRLIFTFDTASTSATATTSAKTIQLQVSLDYTNLVQSGVLTTEATLEAKRIDWGSRV